MKLVKKYRNKVDVVLVEGGIIKINRTALEMHDVDILSSPELNRRDCGIDHVLARLGSSHRVAIELNFKNLMDKKYYDRAKILWAFRRNLFLAKNTTLLL